MSTTTVLLLAGVALLLAPVGLTAAGAAWARSFRDAPDRTVPLTAPAPARPARRRRAPTVEDGWLEDTTARDAATLDGIEHRLGMRLTMLIERAMREHGVPAAERSWAHLASGEYRMVVLAQ